MKEYEEKGHSVSRILSDVDQSMEVCVLRSGCLHAVCRHFAGSSNIK